jgi:hypothetical protein
VGVLKKLDAIRFRFFWQGGSGKRKYRLARWHIVCQPKALGGLGVSNLAIKIFTYSANGSTNYLMRMGCGNSYSKINI